MTPRKEATFLINLICVIVMKSYAIRPPSVPPSVPSYVNLQFYPWPKWLLYPQFKYPKEMLFTRNPSACSAHFYSLSLSLSRARAHNVSTPAISLFLSSSWRCHRRLCNGISTITAKRTPAIYLADHLSLPIPSPLALIYKEVSHLVLSTMIFSTKRWYIRIYAIFWFGRKI